MVRDTNWTNDKEVLLDAAKCMEELAKQFCSSNEIATSVMKSKSDACDCKWYHAAWGYCRLLNLIPSPSIHDEYYQQFFEKNRDRQEINVLISGTADYTILEHITRKLPLDLYDKVTFTILDLCQTPLKMCNWYNEKRVQLGEKAVNIHYVQSDAKRTNLASDQFDLITTYSFLSRFDSKSQRDVVAEWHRLLKVGGAVITSDRITSEYDSGFFQTTQMQQNRFIELAKVRLRAINGLEESKKLEILELIKNYIYNIESFSFPTTSSFCSLFDKFVYDIDVKQVPGESEPMETYIVLCAQKQ